MYNLIIFGVLLLVGYVVGQYLEGRHYKSIREREANLVHLPVTDLKRPLRQDDLIEGVCVGGSVVISVDYFKRFIAGLRNLIGGNVTTYETLIDRGRREAILRMKESAMDADEIINVRIETSSISKGSKNNRIGSVEVYAYGTALKYK